ncbi:aromatic-ring hydroxylase C-terminal domain-containing protein [Streptomyces sp. NB004]
MGRKVPAERHPEHGGGPGRRDRTAAGGPALLLVFGEEGRRCARRARAWSGALRLVCAEPTPDIPCDALLVRPDGYVAWASARGGEGPGEALARYFGSRRVPVAERRVLAGAVS